MKTYNANRMILLFSLIYYISANHPTDHYSKSVSIHADINTLVHVHAIWRHGDRTPSAVLPTDIENNEFSWPEGLGELTTKGVRQQYRLGKWLRERYKGFLASEMGPKEIYVRSSDYNRTLMSAEAVLAGLFPPTRKTKWSEEILWWPIPVHTIPRDEDKELCESVICPEAEKELANIFSSNEDIARLEYENAHLLRYIGDNIGRRNFGLRYMWDVFDPLYAVFSHNESHKFPHWVNSSVWKEIVRLYDLSMKFYFISDKMKKLRGGMLLKDITNRISSIAKKSSQRSEKVYAYSAHDMTIGAFLSTLDIILPVFPQYSTVVLLELHKINETSLIRLFYKNITDSPELYELTIGDCGKECTVERFISFARRRIPNDYYLECGSSSWQAVRISTLMSIIGILSVLAIFFGTIAMGRCFSEIVGLGSKYKGRTLIPTTENSEANFL